MYNDLFNLRPYVFAFKKMRDNNSSCIYNKYKKPYQNEVTSGQKKNSWKVIINVI